MYVKTDSILCDSLVLYTHVSLKQSSHSNILQWRSTTTVYWLVNALLQKCTAVNSVKLEFHGTDTVTDTNTDTDIFAIIVVSMSA